MSKHDTGWKLPTSTSAARRERRKRAEQQRRQAETAARQRAKGPTLDAPPRSSHLSLSTTRQTGANPRR